MTDDSADKSTGCCIYSVLVMGRRVNGFDEVPHASLGPFGRRLKPLLKVGQLRVGESLNADSTEEVDERLALFAYMRLADSQLRRDPAMCAGRAAGCLGLTG